MNRRAFTTRTLTVIAGLFGASRVSADVEKLQALDERLEVLSEGLNKSTEAFGDDWPPVHVDCETRPCLEYSIGISGKDGKEVSNVVVALNEAEGWIEMYPEKSAGDGLIGYGPIIYHGNYRVTGMTREQRIEHNERYGSPFDANKLAYAPQAESGPIITAGEFKSLRSA